MILNEVIKIVKHFIESDEQVCSHLPVIATSVAPGNKNWEPYTETLKYTDNP